MTRLVASALTKSGLRVTVATFERGQDEFEFEVCRVPSPLRLMQLYRRADYCVLNGDSLRLGWPAFLNSKIVVCLHHITPRATSRAFDQFFRRKLATCVANFAPSQALAREIEAKLGVPCGVLPNPFDDRVFQSDAKQTREAALVYVGRLIPEKGVHVLLAAIHHLTREGVIVRCTIIGDGPERARLQEMSREFGICEFVQFVGQQEGDALANSLRRHSIIIIPSTGWETFPTVALEAIACGCVAIGSTSGGIAEAIGPCGITFSNGDAQSLASCIRTLLAAPAALQAYREAAPQHLNQHLPAQVAQHYIARFRELARA